MISCLVQLVSLAEQGVANDEQHHQNTDSDIGILQLQTEDVEFHAGGDLVDHTDKSHTKEGCALAADVHEAVEFAAALRGDDLAQVAAAHGLDAALEHTNQNSQDPELPQGHQEHAEQGNDGVADDADLDAAVLRIEAVEAKAAANETAIKSFVRISEEEISGLFA